MIELKVTQIGNSLGVVLPKEAVNSLNVAKGDVLYLLQQPEGFLLTSYDPKFIRTLEIAEEAMDRYRNALHELAK